MARWVFLFLNLQYGPTSIPCSGFPVLQPPTCHEQRKELMHLGLMTWLIGFAGRQCIFLLISRSIVEYFGGQARGMVGSPWKRAVFAAADGCWFCTQSLTVLPPALCTGICLHQCVCCSLSQGGWQWVSVCWGTTRGSLNKRMRVMAPSTMLLPFFKVAYC